MNRIKEAIKECINHYLSKRKQATWKEIKYFHPEGRTMPNGSHYQRGGFLEECRNNSSSFVLDKVAHEYQCGTSNLRGGIIVFPSNAEKVGVGEYNIKVDVGEYSVGNFFRGKYVGASGEIYDSNSLSIQIYGHHGKSLLKLAESIAKESMQKTVLVKDLNNNKIYLSSCISELHNSLEIRK